MVGVQDVGDVESSFRLRRRLGAIEQVEKMRSFVEVSPHGRELEPLSGSVEIGGNDTDFGGDADRAAMIGVLARLFVTKAAVIESEHGDCRSHHVHRVGRGRSRLNEIHNALRKLALAS